jgi:hypothetical protein
MYTATMVQSPGIAITRCPRCGQIVSEQVSACPNCGTLQPDKEKRGGRGFEYKSEASWLGLLWLHISFTYRADRVPVPAKGIIAISQFAFGVVTISQFGVGLLSLGQFTIAGYTIAQIALAFSLIAQFGVYLHDGHGQLSSVSRRSCGGSKAAGKGVRGIRF